MTASKKVVLVSTRPYDASQDHILQTLLDRKVELLCVVGVDCRMWEETMDAIVVGSEGTYEWHVTTTSHPDESVADVVAFAESWTLEAPSAVEVIEL